MYNHNKSQQSKNRVHISWDILYCLHMSDCIVTTNPKIELNYDSDMNFLFSLEEPFHVLHCIMPRGAHKNDGNIWLKYLYPMDIVMLIRIMAQFLSLQFMALSRFMTCGEQ